MSEALFQIQNLTKRFGPNLALKGINLSIKRGDIFGIIGMSGAGKSTLIRCLSFLEKPTDGKIILGSQDLTTLSKQQLRSARKKIGMIFQHFNLFSSRTALENAAYPLEIEGISKKKREDRAKNLLHMVGLQGKEGHYPSQLSGGEKQRVAIARALAGEPEVLLCDEATSALDPRTTRSILELLSEINARMGLTIVLITHEMEVIKTICTNVAVLEHGAVVEQGTTVQLFSQPKHATTKRFLHNLIHDIPPYIAIKGDLLRLSFTGQSACRPVISRLIKEFAVEVNILLGGIDVLKTETVGNLVISLSGDPKECKKACSFLESEGVKWEMITS